MCWWARWRPNERVWHAAAGQLLWELQAAKEALEGVGHAIQSSAGERDEHRERGECGLPPPNASSDEQQLQQEALSADANASTSVMQLLL